MSAASLGTNRVRRDLYICKGRVGLQLKYINYVLKIFPCLQRVLSQNGFFFFLPTSSSAVCFVVRVHRQFSLDCISSFTSVCVCIIHKSTANFITNTITQVNFIGYLAEWETGDGETLALYHIHLLSPGPGRCLVFSWSFVHVMKSLNTTRHNCKSRRSGETAGGC